MSNHVTIADVNNAMKEGVDTWEKLQEHFGGVPFSQPALDLLRIRKILD